MIGQTIARARSAQGISQSGLARQCGVGASHICQIEAGQDRPSRTLAREIAKSLDLDEDEVLLEAGYIPDDIVQLLKGNPALCKELRMAGNGERKGKP